MRISGLPLAILLLLFCGAGRTQAATRIVQVGPGGTLTFQDTVSGTNTTTIAAGDTVQWDWLTGFHSTTRATGPEAWDSGQQPPPFSFSRVFLVPGTYSYLCTVHGIIMSGTVVVQPAVTPTPTTTLGPTTTPAPTATPGPGAAVPTLSPWTLALFALALAGIGFLLIQKHL